MNKTSVLVALCVAQLCAETFVLTNARIVPVSAPVIERGAVVVQDGKIAAVGAQIKPPAGAKKIDATGLTVYPGMIDGYTSLGLKEISSVKGSLDTTEIGASLLSCNPNPIFASQNRDARESLPRSSARGRNSARVVAFGKNYVL